ncbi:alpha/beta fold hydrolase [Hyphomicrobium sp. ghe19]|uniref:alpha/beta fold hydrolase n=1 Tax=Hyphomicrobium sp. ghe19 TaxID=2682968 RepID=UPI00136755E4|nr:Haloalkane dehalogenase [Hyphomicrobium sp. ghe19]
MPDIDGILTILKRSLVAVAATLILVSDGTQAQSLSSPSTSATTTYQTLAVDGVKIFYREAGPRHAPALLLLHGFPSSSRMFDTLIPLLADRYHIVAPDYPGFGLSDAPPASAFAYTFDHEASVIEGFIEALGLKKYVLFMQDYGGPVGFRLAVAHPERVQAMIVQNAVAHEAGLGPIWVDRKAYWKNRAAHEGDFISSFTSLDACRQRHVGTSPHIERYNPDIWAEEFAALSRPGQAKIQADLFYDYRNNVASYSRWQAWLRQYKPPMLVVWGKYDPSFAVAGATAYAQDVPDAEIHILDAGHFALDEAVDQIAALMRTFLARQKLDAL